MEREQGEPRYHSGRWVQDQNGWYLPFKSHGGDYEMRDHNTVIFIHDEKHSPLDHIFVVLDWREDQDQCQGMYVWRYSTPYFDAIVGDAMNREFDVRFPDVPDPHDQEKYREMFARRQDLFDEVVAEAMADIDVELVELLDGGN